MPAEEENIEIRSEEVQEVLGHIPIWIIRWGITMVFVVVLVLLTASWFIKYPDTVSATIVITTKNPPVHFISRTGGTIVLHKRDNQSVKTGDILGLIENPASTKHIVKLSKQLVFIKKLIYNQPANIDEIVIDKSLDLGALQGVYSSFVGALDDRKRFASIQFYDNQRAALNERITYYQRLNKKFQNQKKLLMEEIAIAEGIYLDDSVLYTEGAGTKTEMNRSKSSYYREKRTAEGLSASIIQNNIQIVQFEDQANELKLKEREELAQFRDVITQAYEKLESELAAWKQNYLFISPIDGKLSLSRFWTNGQYVQAGLEVFTVVPVTEKLKSQVKMSVQGSGKVKPGQTVNIKLDNYPYSEYGAIRGKVETISEVPTENLYYINISLPNGLVSTYNKTLEFKQEMQGVADIVTEDKRLIERIFNQLRKIIDEAG